MEKKKRKKRVCLSLSLATNAYNVLSMAKLLWKFSAMHNFCSCASQFIVTGRWCFYRRRRRRRHRHRHRRRLISPLLSRRVAVKPHHVRVLRGKKKLERKKKLSNLYIKKN